MILSLIQTSQNRRAELIRFVESLNKQQGIDLSSIQLIFVDQEDNKDVFDNLSKNIEFTYIKYHHCSLSNARNIALQHVKGQFVGFPDDDCWYEPDTLQKALFYLQDGKYQGVTGKGTNEKGQLTSIFPEKADELTVEKRCAAISYTLFFKYCPELKFDEVMGVGSEYNIGAGEETDYLLTLMEKYAYRVYYDPSISIHHPTGAIYNNEKILKRAYSYARGAGYLTRKHNFSFIYKAKLFFRPLIGIFVNFIKMDMIRCRKSYLNLKGRIEGYFFKLTQ